MEPEEAQPQDPAAERERKLIEAARQQASAHPPPADDTHTSASLLSEATRLSPAQGSVAAPRTPLPPPGSFPGYEIVRELSRGGQGVVYEALQTGTKRAVAIKVLREGFHASESALRRFEREIELAAQLNHPNVVAVFHSGVAADGQPFYVMDYVDGIPLHTYVRQSGLALEQVLGLYVQVCDAVAHAHRRGVIHRDLKPSNILVDKAGVPKILDFGLARSLTATGDQPLTLTHEVMGTLPYMSPEQARGETTGIDTRTDVYSLGVILYELLTGHFPYPVRGQLLEVIRNITETPPTPPIQRWSHESGVVRRSSRRLRARGCPIDDELQTIILKALAKEQERRYQGADHLARDIGHYLAGEPIEAKRDSAWYVLRKLARHHAAATVVIISVFVIAVSAAIICFDFYWQASQALAQQVASDVRLADRNRAFDADGEAVKAAVQRMSLGWFLLEWHDGRQERAQQILAQTPQNLPERTAMTFLLDPNMSREQLLAEMPSGSAALAYFACGERAYRVGQSAEAQRWFEQCLSEGVGWIAESARARLAQLTAAGTSAARAGVE